ncbi:MAG: hypothetical protein LBU89_13535 [Fibromonadaceae bacterium]|jgi:hypothetical protein|nr:hypothetical protein [Fibromonadaceae bacterium]
MNIIKPSRFLTKALTYCACKIQTLFLVSVALFAWNCSSNSNDGPSTGEVDKDKCIKELAEDKSKTPNAIMTECKFTDGEKVFWTLVAGNLQFGECESNDNRISADKTLGQIEADCKAVIITPSSSSDFVYSSSSGLRVPSSSSQEEGGTSSSGVIIDPSSSSVIITLSSSSDYVSSSSNIIDPSSSSALVSSASSSSSEESTQTGGQQSSSSTFIFVLDTAYAFEYDWLKEYINSGYLPSDEFLYDDKYKDQRRMYINPATNKYWATSDSKSGKVGNFNSIYCADIRNVKGAIINVQADLTFADIVPVTDANINFAKGLHSASKTQVRAKMDSVSNHYPNNQSADRRRILRYALFVEEDGYEWFGIKHVRYANCSTAGFTELCNESTVKNLIGQGVSFNDCGDPDIFSGQAPEATVSTFDMWIQKIH